MIEQHVTSLDLSKRLKELGVWQNAILSWVPDIPTIHPPNPNYIEGRCLLRGKPFVTLEPDNFFSAFLASELLSMIKAHIRISKDHDSDDINIYYQPENGTDNSYSFNGTNLANLLAEVLIAQINEKEFNLKNLNK